MGSVTIRPFEVADMALLGAPQVAQVASLAGRSSEQLAQAALQLGPAWTAEGFGRVLAIAGFWVPWHGRAVAWAYLARDIPRVAWVAFHRAAQAGFTRLRDEGFWRVEAEVACDFEPGKRWVRLLGFEPEGPPMRYFAPDGTDCQRFVRFL